VYHITARLSSSISWTAGQHSCWYFHHGAVYGLPALQTTVCCPRLYGQVFVLAMTTESGVNDAITLSRVNFTGYLWHVTIFSSYYCMLFSSRVRVIVRITFSAWLVSGHAYIFILLSVFIVILPNGTTTQCFNCTSYMLLLTYLLLIKGLDDNIAIIMPDSLYPIVHHSLNAQSELSPILMSVKCGSIATTRLAHWGNFLHQRTCEITSKCCFIVICH